MQLTMAKINQIFQHIEQLIRLDYELTLNILNKTEEKNDENSAHCVFNSLEQFLRSIFGAIDDLSQEIKKDNTILISVKNQKLLRKCFQLTVSLGISQCLIPGLGISLSKRCISTINIKEMTLSDEQKYEVLVICTDFFTRCFDIPILKTLLTTYHLCDYLASLIQLSFAPFKQPGTYGNFTMTEEMYEKLNVNKKKYGQIYENIVNNCFQPTLMKELLMLQNVTDKSTPGFVKRVIANEMSRRLIASGGLLSLIRCFLEAYNEDSGHDWKKIEIISKIVATKHGNTDEEGYLSNITSQLSQILNLNNVQYLATVITCILKLYEKYPQSICVRNLKTSITQCFDLKLLLSKSTLPGTIILTPQEVERKVNVLHCTLCVVKFEWDATILASNLFVLYLLGIECTKAEMKTKLRNITLKCLEFLDLNKTLEIVKSFLYGMERRSSLHISVKEYDAGITIKCVSDISHPKEEAILYFIDVFNSTTNVDVAQKLLSSCLQIFTEINLGRKIQISKEQIISFEDGMISDYEESQSNILQLLSEISSSPIAISVLKKDPMFVIEFVDTLISKNVIDINEEYVTIALVLLNTILSNTDKSEQVRQKLPNLIPALKKLAENETSYNAILCKELLSLISSDYPKQKDSAYTRAMTNVFDNLLPARAHGIIELTKLIDNKDLETISKRHYIFCLLQDQLKDRDSYIYLSAINCIASLATYCTEDVLSVLCREFLHVSKEHDAIVTSENENSIDELRMKIGDIIVKVTKRLGEMAVVHKAILLNTMLCACRDDNPLIRTSALSNLAEIAMVLNYKMGTIIYEVLLCIWCTIETDKAIDCRRAAVMVISGLLKGLDKETLIELKENLLPIYRTLNRLYKDDNEDTVVRLHAQIAIEELNDIVKQYLIADLTMERKFVIGEPKDIKLI